MRLPFSRIYRGFPELDKFSDEECCAYIARARAKHKPSLRVAMACAVPVSTAVSLIVLTLMIAAAGWVRAMQPSTLRNKLEVAFDLATPIVVIPVGAVIILLMYDFWLRWAIRKDLIRAVCPRCGYSLLGLNVVDASVVCPECGDAIRLTNIGLTPADVLAEQTSVPFAKKSS